MSKPAKPLKPIPKFRSHEEAGEFWMTHDTTEYLDWSKAQRVQFPKLRPSTTTISLRLPQGMLDELRIRANQQDVPYQSLLKVYLAERLAAERGRSLPEQPNKRLQPTKARRPAPVGAKAKSTPRSRG
jgi:predicted DNA binding CopG/RHH family protein